MKKSFKNIIIMLIFAVVLFYLMLPAINLTSPGFWMYIIILLFIYLILNTKMVKSNIVFSQNNLNFTGNPFNFGKAKYALVAICIIVIGMFVINVICSPLFNASSYANRIEVLDTSDFTTDIKEVNFNSIPLLDKDSSRKLGDRKMGQITDLVSQYVVSNLYTQINYNGEIVRVTPLEYASMIKYFTNSKNGISGYITVNSVTGESNLVRLEEGMRYSPSALFFENLKRQLRIQYPTTIFGESNFEIDNEGNPYWIVQTIKYRGIGLKKEVSGVIVLNAIDGTSVRYNNDEVPSWIDHVYDANLIIEQVDNWGEYNNGFLNSIFGQKNVINTTDGYTYLAIDDDIYMYTGITSVSTDESNIGFILTNLRTKETHFYSVPGAEEYSAMSSAEGLVQEKGYTASFPLLVNLKGRPTYLLSLKDQAGLVKMYSFVDVEDYQKVSVSDSSLGIEAAAEKYLNDYNFAPSKVSDRIEKTITVKTITTAVIDGTTYYYIIDTEGNLYSTSIKINRSILPFVKEKDVLNITYNEANVNEIVALEK